MRTPTSSCLDFRVGKEGYCIPYKSASSSQGTNLHKEWTTGDEMLLRIQNYTISRVARLRID